MDTMKYVLTLGSWSFTTVFVSFLFLYIGIWIDGILKMEPAFTIGLFFLGVCLCIGRLYKEAWEKRG
jgi:F0F1-type ATP synthase assembly protein I